MSTHPDPEEARRRDNWPDLGVKIPWASSNENVRVSRHTGSGTYEFIREHLLQEKDFKLESRDMNNSNTVVKLAASAPTAAGCSGLGYASAAVKMLKAKQAPTDPAYGTEFGRHPRKNPSH